MMEIERKYLVRHAGYRDLSRRRVTICQGYLTHDAARSVRIRIAGDSAWITIKGRSSDDGLQRYEWEQPVELHQAQQLMRLCLPGRVEKTRYYVDWQGLTIEVDEFHGQNEGLIVAEIELPSPDCVLNNLPDFIGREVTGDSRYYNQYLSSCPYTDPAWGQPQQEHNNTNNDTP